MKHFWDKVNKDAESGCWEWKGRVRQSTGHGQFRLDGRTRTAHAVSLILAGIDPSTVRAQWRCENKTCVNPEHLMPIRVPIEPILSHIEAAGGLAAFFEQEEYEKPLNGSIALRISKDVAAKYALSESRLRAATNQGWMDYFMADEFCIDVLNYHPALIFGGDWWNYPNNKALQARLAGREEEAA